MLSRKPDLSQANPPLRKARPSCLTCASTSTFDLNVPCSLSSGPSAIKLRQRRQLTELAAIGRGPVVDGHSRYNGSQSQYTRLVGILCYEPSMASESTERDQLLRTTCSLPQVRLSINIENSQNAWVAASTVAPSAARVYCRNRLSDRHTSAHGERPSCYFIRLS